MDWLKSLYPEVWDILRKAVPEYWPELSQVVNWLIGDQLIPEAILPLASCKAVGGDARNAIHVSAALTAAATSLRVLDDLEDQDRPSALWNQVGTARTWNYAAAFQSMSFDLLGQAPLEPHRAHQIISAFIDMYLHMTYGQDRDIIGNTRSIEDYWATVAEKIAYGYATGCAVGAMVATDKTDLIKACRDFGFHLGFVIQIVNDLQSIWSPRGVTDLKQGKVTLPLLYGLTTDHPKRDELAILTRDGKIAPHEERIKEILDSIDTKSFLIWTALTERDRALQAISLCPDSEGRQALEAYVTGLFGDIEPLMPIEKGTPPGGEKQSKPKK
jgi:geranylgeranyl diphosphate synthase type I